MTYTTDVRTSSSSIQALALEVGGARLAWESGEGDAKLRGWEFANGTEAIETNGDPLWSESTEGFAALWEAQGELPAPRAATLRLYSGAMGDVSEADFDAWAAYVQEHLEIDGLDITVERARFGEAGEDALSGDCTEDEAESAHEACAHGLWDAFCSDDSAWPSRSAAVSLDIGGAS